MANSDILYPNVSFDEPDVGSRNVRSRALNRIGIIGTFSRGPANKITYLSTEKELTTLFGDDSARGSVIAQSALDQGAADFGIYRLIPSARPAKGGLVISGGPANGNGTIEVTTYYNGDSVGVPAGSINYVSTDTAGVITQGLINAINVSVESKISASLDPTTSNPRIVFTTKGAGIDSNLYTYSVEKTGADSAISIDFVPNTEVNFSGGEDPAYVSALRFFNGAGLPVLQIQALSAGSYGNNIAVTITKGSAAGKFNLLVTDQGTGLTNPQVKLDFYGRPVLATTAASINQEFYPNLDFNNLNSDGSLQQLTGSNLIAGFYIGRGFGSVPAGPGGVNDFLTIPTRAGNIRALDLVRGSLDSSDDTGYSLVQRIAAGSVKGIDSISGLPKTFKADTDYRLRNDRIDWIFNVDAVLNTTSGVPGGGGTAYITTSADPVTGAQVYNSVIGIGTLFNTFFQVDSVISIGTSTGTPELRTITEILSDTQLIVSVPFSSNNTRIGDTQAGTFSRAGSPGASEPANATNGTGNIVSTATTLDSTNVSVTTVTGDASAKFLGFLESGRKVIVNGILGAGTITSSGVTVGGSGTNFTAALMPGDIITCDSKTATVASVTDNLNLTLVAAFSSDVSGETFTYSVKLPVQTVISDTRFTTSVPRVLTRIVTGLPVRTTTNIPTGTWTYTREETYSVTIEESSTQSISGVTLNGGTDGPLATLDDYVAGISGDFSQNNYNYCVVAGPDEIITDPDVQLAQVLVAEDSTELDGLKIAILCAPKVLDVSTVRDQFSYIQSSSKSVLVAGWSSYSRKPQLPRFSVPPVGFYVGHLAVTPYQVSPAARTSSPAFRSISEVNTPTGRTAYNELVLGRLEAIIIDPSNGGFHCLSGKSLSTDPAFYYVSIRRVYNLIRETLFYSLQWAKSEPNTQTTRSQIEDAVDTYLRQLQLEGIIAGYSRTSVSVPAQAYANGRLQVDLTFAPIYPADFINVSLRRSVNVAITVQTS